MISTCNIYTNWSTEIRNLLFTIVLGHVWIKQHVDNVNAFLNIVKSKLQDECIQNFQSSIHTSSKGRLYKQLNVNFELQDYFKILPDRKYITPRVKLGINCHNLFSETGSWSRGTLNKMNEILFLKTEMKKIARL